jgi:hypothetical protein
MTELTEKLERVTDLESFLDFVMSLAADRRDEVAKERINPSNRYGHGANGWENTTVEDFGSLVIAVKCPKILWS